MMEVFFTFPGTHAAMSAEKKLLAEGIAVRVMPLPDEVGAGCGMCLRVACADAARAAAALRGGTGPGYRESYAIDMEDGKAVYRLWPISQAH